MGSRWSVRTYLLGLVLACLLPGILGASALFLHEFREGRAQLEKDTIQTARALSQAVDNEISRLQALAQGLATADSLTRGDFKRFHAHARRALEISGLGISVVLTDAHGQQLLNTHAEFGEPLPVHPEPGFVLRVFETGRPAVSDLFSGTVLQRPLVGVAVPVMVDGKITYSLSIAAVPETFKKILTAQGLPEGRVATILDRSTTIVARSRASETYAGQKPAQLFIERRGATDEGALEFVMKDGVGVLSVFTRSPLTGWTVAINIPLEPLQAQLEHRLSQMTVGVLVLFVIGIGLAWIIGGEIARAIRAMRASAVALGTGQTFSVPPHRVQEVADVTDAMGKAIALLNERTAALQASEERYRTLFANMTEAFILGEPILDEQGRPVDVRFLVMNDAFFVETGIRPNVEGLPLRQYLPRVEDIWIERYAAVALTGKPDRFDSYNTDTQRHYDVHVFCPSPGQFAVLGRDITEQKRMETALRLAEVRFRRLCEANLIGIVIADGKGVIIEANDYYLNLIGYSRQEFAAGQVDWGAITPPEWVPSDEAALAQLAATGICSPYEKEYVLRDGARRAVFIAVAGLPGEGELHIDLVLDITGRRRAEEELVRLNADLERQVRERTTELVQLQKMDAIGQLTGGIAHDFNNVLQGLASCLFVLERYVPEGAPKALFQSAKRSIESGARLTQGLLAFARRQTLQPEPVALPALFDSMAPLLQRTLGGLIRVEFEAQPGTPDALVDRAQLESALLNLAINARDAMPSGGRLTLRAAAVAADAGQAAELAPGEYVAISVEDTGSGMNEATLARVFEPFFTTKDFGKGSGLGLSMVHGMAAQSGGGVSISSQPGIGTTVTLYLPRAASCETKPTVTRVRLAPGDGSTVLLVDDNDLMRDALKMTLEDRGYRVLEAASGESALVRLQNGEHIDVMVTDYAMPGMSGAELTQKARRLDPALPVLLVTGYAEKLDDMEGIALLHKPFQTEDLVTRVAALINGRAPAKHPAIEIAS